MRSITEDAIKIPFNLPNSLGRMIIKITKATEIDEIIIFAVMLRSENRKRPIRKIHSIKLNGLLSNSFISLLRGISF